MFSGQYGPYERVTKKMFSRKPFYMLGKRQQSRVKATLAVAKNQIAKVNADMMNSMDEDVARVLREVEEHQQYFAMQERRERESTSSSKHQPVMISFNSSPGKATVHEYSTSKDENVTTDPVTESATLDLHFDSYLAAQEVVNERDSLKSLLVKELAAAVI